MNEQILKALKTVSIESKYTKWYIRLVSRDHSVKEEKHHIVPVSLNTELKSNPENIVMLSCRQHYIAHLLLTKMTIGQNHTKMVRALWFLSKRSPKIGSKLFEKMRLKWAEHMLSNNPMKKKEISLKISKALTGRTKKTHEYLRLAGLKKSQYTIENSEWLKKSREKFNATIELMSEDERKQKFGHVITKEEKQKQSQERTGKTKENCERVRKMSETKRNRAGEMTIEERKKRFSKTLGYRWYHNNELKSSKLLPPHKVESSSWMLGRKFYEN